MKKITWVVLVSCLSFTLAGNVWSQAIMHPDEATFSKWLDDYANAPKAYLDEAIGQMLEGAQAAGQGTSMSLLDQFAYDPATRNQQNCGDCWVWADTAVMQIALAVQNGIEDPLSTQFLNSCETSTYACCGGNATEFASFYGGKGFTVPWANANASFMDGSLTCSSKSSADSCKSISTTPN